MPHEEQSGPVEAIDAALAANTTTDPNGRCGTCGQPVDVSSPSADFCSEDCQDTWHTRRIDTPPADGGAAPTEGPEPAPPVSLSWLGTPPPGAIVRDGAAILDDVVEFIRRYNVFPSEHCAPMLALWYAHTHAANQFYVTPRLILSSAEPGSGKTRVLEVGQYLVANPIMTISVTTPAVYRLLMDGPRTLLFDEIDTVFNAKNGGNNEDLRALLNAGYKRTATVHRCVGDARNMKVETFPVYAPAAMAGIAGHMPDTITTRAVTIPMRRRAPDEHVEPFHERTVEREAPPLRDELAAWIDTTAQRLGDAMPTMPAGVTDRAAEIWEPLLAIADAADSHWPQTARTACEHFVLHNRSRDTGSLGIRLLADLRDLYQTNGVDRMHTADIIDALRANSEAPWADLHDRGLNARDVSRLLGRYDITPREVRVPGKTTTAKGYRLEDGLADAFRRYLPAESATSATAATSQVNPVADTAGDPQQAQQTLPNSPQ